MNISEWLAQSWLMLSAIVAGIAVIFKLIEQVKDVKGAVLRPVDEINQKLDRLNEKQEMQCRAVLSLQRKSLLDSCEMYLKRGFASIKEKETISKQFDSYHELGGNSFIGDMVHEVKELPLEKKPKKESPTK